MAATSPVDPIVRLAGGRRREELLRHAQEFHRPSKRPSWPWGRTVGSRGHWGQARR